MASQTQSSRVQSTIRRLQDAISKEQYDVAQQIIEGMSEKDVRYMALAMGLALFGNGAL